MQNASETLQIISGVHWALITRFHSTSNAEERLMGKTKQNWKAGNKLNIWNKPVIISSFKSNYMHIAVMGMFKNELPECSVIVK